jgi:hypothetical protein
MYGFLVLTVASRVLARPWVEKRQWRGAVTGVAVGVTGAVLSLTAGTVGGIGALLLGLVGAGCVFLAVGRVLRILTPADEALLTTALGSRLRPLHRIVRSLAGR